MIYVFKKETITGKVKDIISTHLDKSHPTDCAKYVVLNLTNYNITISVHENLYKMLDKTLTNMLTSTQHIVLHRRDECSLTISCIVNDYF